MFASDVDVAVVGAGIVGSAVAASCARGGARVALVDPDPGSGATYAAAGMLSPFGELEHTEAVAHALHVVAAEQYPSFVDGLPGGAAGCSYERSATLLVGFDSADARRLDDLIPLANGAARRIGMAQARRTEPLLAPGLSRALVAEHDHRVDPRALAAAVREELGDRVVREPAEGLLRGAAGRTRGVRLASGREIRADETVIAVGTGSFGAAELSGAVRPVHGDILRLRAPAAARLSGTVRGWVRGRAVYVVPRPDGTVVIGATQREDRDPGVWAGGVAALLRDAIELVPAVEEYRFIEATARARPSTRDHLPLVGRLGDGLLAATGTHRNGVLLAPLIGAIIRSITSGTPPIVDISRLSPARFATRPLEGVTA
ncbi:FAD-dependent oxidoreductase [Microbacterium amylolyticum]|uniref:Glycine oxidase n=1 Tax=Microbacterium amylolyticum TaxID=936337 RepID=A0ABS4ZIK7_9MICO|nr:FAD-dependent oxidoreductase [Microbacterium amylolyticum]MBP2436321.1 glycine oxidase [Microbacterium amylolyticum]